MIGSFSPFLYSLYSISEQVCVYVTGVCMRHMDRCMYSKLPRNKDYIHWLLSLSLCSVYSLCLSL
ncbi:hypothetical protein J4Q44_G00037790 [Coregonus suidteri]|uniref:Uncharacterized protein n=1 Tax=Coregonus suidteri TaxID=861788 RepID=A0AAN8MCU6_9TELE